MLSIFKCIVYSSLVYSEEVKLTVIIIWILQVSDFCKSILISSKNDKEWY